MGLLIGGFFGLIVGILTIIFRRKFRFDGPAGVGPVFDTDPTSKTEQTFVMLLGVAFILVGLVMFGLYVSRSTRG